MKLFFLLFCEIAFIGLFIIRTVTYINQYKPAVRRPALYKVVKNTVQQSNSAQV